jgi:serine/threonine-protein kinase
LAVSVADGGSSNVWVYDLLRDAFAKLTFGNGSGDPVWSLDGRYLIFASLGAGLSWTRADGAGQAQRLIEQKSIQIPRSVSPDGKRLAFFEVGAPDGWLFTVALSEENGQLKAGKPERFFESKFTDAVPEFSVDGRWIAYETNDSGRLEVNVRAFPAPAPGQGGGKWQISTNGGATPKWSRNSRELLYQEGDRIMAVGYTANGDSFVADRPRVRVEKLGGTIWDVAPDGRIVLLKPVESGEAQAAEHTVVFLENFTDELRRRVPAGK